MSEQISVHKRNIAGEVTWSYQGRVLARGENYLHLEALFNREDTPFQGIVIKHNDRFVEMFFTERWYNIFEIHDRDDDRIKGWYCNVGRPMVWDGPDAISYIDLALDLWVAADGSQTVLDEDEFDALTLDNKTRQQALDGLLALKTLFADGLHQVQEIGQDFEDNQGGSCQPKT
jgi:uncharacterized protein